MNSRDKILSLEELGQHAVQLKQEGKKIVHCHGVFDLLHPGHFKHFEAARKFGDVLVVTLTEDKHVNKGPDRPIFDENLRAETIASVAFVDHVAINHAATAIPAIEAVQPDFYVKGQDYKDKGGDVTGGIYKEKEAVERIGGELVHTEEVQFSSSRLINRYLSPQDEETESYLSGFRDKYKFEELKERFDEIANYKVLVIGDIILDEYQFVNALGKASKSATITAKMLDKELYAGGALAVANHVADFVGRVTFLSTYGINEGKNYLDFIQSHLHKNVEFKAIHTPDRPTTLKRRFVDRVFKHKLFEATEIDDSPLSGEPRKEFHDFLDQVEGDFDLVLVADFGHGLLDPDSVEKIAGKDFFLAVNAQTNSANKGFNLLTKYPRCDYFSIDKDEARLAVHDKYKRIETIHDELMAYNGAKLSSITLGVDGSVVSDQAGTRAYAPVLTSEVVDTIGAGDAFLSITSLLARNGASEEEMAFVGNATGAMAVKILGNKSYIERTSLLKYLKTLLS